MSTTWNAPMASSGTVSAGRTVINDCLETLRTTHSGTADPASMVAYMLQIRSDTNDLQCRNAANSGWVVLMPDVSATNGGLLALSGGTMTGAIAMGSQKITGLANGTASGDAVNKGQVDGRIHMAPVSIPGISATANFPLCAGTSASFVISDVKIISDTATTGSDGSNNYTFQVDNFTQTLNLRSAAKSTNGADISANTVYSLGLDQNLTIAASDVLRLVVVKTGTPTSLTSAKIIAQINYKVTT